MIGPQHIVAYPISHGQLINIAAFDADYDQEGSIFTNPWIQERDSGEVTNSYKDWEPEVKQLVGVRFSVPLLVSDIG